MVNFTGVMKIDNCYYNTNNIIRWYDTRYNGDAKVCFHLNNNEKVYESTTASEVKNAFLQAEETGFSVIA